MGAQILVFFVAVAVEKRFLVARAGEQRYGDLGLVADCAVVYNERVRTTRQKEETKKKER